MTRTFRNFALVGGIAALVNWGSRFGFQHFMSLEGAVVAAFFAGLLTGYVLNRLFVFEPSGRKIADEAARFALVNLFALGAVWLVTVGLARHVFPAVGFSWHAEAVAHGVGVLSPALISYFAHRHFTFSKPTAQAEEASTTPPRPDLPLAVDMDGTLLRTDVLAETIVAGLFRRPWAVIVAVACLPAGRARFKSAMARIAPIDVTCLPVRESLVAFLRAEKSQGRTIHLVTAAAAEPAARVAEKFGFFDDVHASTESLNLKGAAKLEYLRGLFPGGFAYVGDSRADLDVWSGADNLVIAGASRSVADRARGLGKPVQAEFDVGSESGTGRWRSALRLHQWSKNVLIFAPLLLGARIADPSAWASCVAGFLALGTAASATYLINDLADLEADRRHRSKRLRALASGDIPVLLALGVALIMLAAAFSASVFIGRSFTLALTFYLALTLSYSFWIKRAPLLDVIVLAGLYTMRLICGTMLAGSIFSAWLLTFSMFFFTSMSLAKRHVEVSSASTSSLDTLPGRGYRPADAPLTLSIGVATSVAAVLIIVQYLITEAFPSRVYAFPAALWAAPLLLSLWVCRIWLFAHRGELDDDPVAFAVKDKVSLALGALLGLAFVVARYG